MQSLKLIALYLYICDVYDTELKYHCQRFSRNGLSPSFTDEELLTVYLFSIMVEKKVELKSIWRYIGDYWQDWFPELPSYQAFSNRINRLASVFPILLQRIVDQCPAQPTLLDSISVMDSFPIKLCSDKRGAKVARELANTGYCATKNMHYHGVKLHFIGFSQPGTMPFPEIMKITPASEHDLSAIKMELLQIPQRTFFADKIYSHKVFNQWMEKHLDSRIYTPIKKKGNESKWERQWEEAYRKCYSRAVSRVRQPVESIFNWFIEKTDLQNAAKVRSTKGLIVHVFGRIAAAFASLIF